VIVNTCGFIDAAVQESLDAIGEALAENGKVIVTGCLGAKKDAAGDDIITKVHPKVLAVTGPHAVTEVMESVHLHLPKPHDPFVDLVPDHGVKLTPKHYAYLKISEGCNHRCSFCIIPSMRGDLVSRPIHEVLKEAENLFKAGVKELLVISQDTSAYGVDVKFRTGFWNGRPIKTHMTQLAEALGQMAKQYGAWVRMHYVYPYPHVDQVIPLMGENLVPYLDIPLQHAHPDVLKRMKRPASGEKNLDRILAWRKMNPDLVIRSTFIAGFPGETEEEFEYLLDFLREAQIDRLGCFAYSPVEGATANELANPVPEAVREERRARVMLLQEEISLKRMQAKVGKTIRVLVDEVGPREAIGRSPPTRRKSTAWSTSSARCSRARPSRRWASSSRWSSPRPMRTICGRRWPVIVVPAKAGRRRSIREVREKSVSRKSRGILEIASSDAQWIPACAGMT
jgi:ribosomal protein S12 methylthiotransferase